MTASNIEGVKVHKLVTHKDLRGFFREVFRFSETYKEVDVGQISHSLVNEGIVKAWHGHSDQHQWNYVVTGILKVGLYDARKNSKSYGKYMNFIVGENKNALAYFFPCGVLHGYRCLKGPMNIIYCTSGTYDLTDEIRVADEGLKKKLLSP